MEHHLAIPSYHQSGTSGEGPKNAENQATWIKKNLKHVYIVIQEREKRPENRQMIWQSPAKKKKKKQALKVNEVDDFKQRQNLKTKH